VTALFLLDTDWIIDHFNGIAPITRRLEQLRPSGLALSVISLAELYEGVHYSRDPAASRTGQVVRPSPPLAHSSALA
jgi:tRNA(fMet)-specific endonuclease VapC